MRPRSPRPARKPRRHRTVMPTRWPSPSPGRRTRSTRHRTAAQSLPRVPAAASGRENPATSWCPCARPSKAGSFNARIAFGTDPAACAHGPDPAGTRSVTPYNPMMSVPSEARSGFSFEGVNLDQLLPGDRDRSVAACDRLVPDLESRSFGADSGLVWLGQCGECAVRERVVLSRVRGSAACFDCVRAVGVLPRGLGPDHSGVPLDDAYVASRNGRRTDGMASHRRHHPSWSRGASTRAHAPDPVRQATRGRHLSHRERRHPPGW